MSSALSVLHRFSQGGRRQSAGSPRDIRLVWCAYEGSFVAGGGVAARFVGSAVGAAFEEPSPEEALEVSGEAVCALFCSLRASLLRMIGLPMQVDWQKEWKLRNAQKQQMEAAGKRVPADFCSALRCSSSRFSLTERRCWQTRPSVLVSSNSGLGWTAVG